MGRVRLGGWLCGVLFGEEILLREEVSWMEKGIVVLIKRFEEETRWTKGKQGIGQKGRE